MNNGPWGTGMVPGYTSWSAQRGNVTFNPQSSFAPMTYQQKYGAPQQAAPAAAQPGPFDFMKDMFKPVEQKPMQVNSSITARPIYTPQQMNAASSKFSSVAPPATTGPLGNAAANLYGQEAGRARIAADRQMSQGNADMWLKSQIARSQSGLGWGRVGSQAQNLADNQAVNQEQYGYALLRQLLQGMY